MSRAIRNYKHSDFSNLLKEMKMERRTDCIAKISSPHSSYTPKSPINEVSKAKRLRDSLMSNPKMRYVYSVSDGVLHDRECICVKSIPDEEFRMISEFSTEMSWCPQCYRKALIRAAVFDDVWRIDAYVNIFERLGASDRDLFTLIIEHKARTYLVGLDFVCLKVHEDKWMIRMCSDGPRLYHNSYTILENNDRLIKNEFHLQNDHRIHTFHHFVCIMSQYSWSAHIVPPKHKHRHHAKT